MNNVIKRKRVATSIVVVILGAILGCGGGGPKQLPESGFQVAFESYKVASEMESDKTVSADITVKNVSPVTWPSKPDSKNRYDVNLSYHWLDKKGKMVIFDGLRTPLPRDLKPGESVDLKAAIQAPERPGRYTLELTLVQERSAWFPEKDGAKLVLPVTVIKSGEVIAKAGDAAAIDMAAGAAAREKKTQLSDKSEGSQKQAKVAVKAPLKATGAAAVEAKTEKPTLSVDAGRGTWSVQVGSYAQKKAAVSLAKKLRDKDYDAYVSVVSVRGREWYRVRVGRLQHKAEAEKLRDTLAHAENLKHSIITSR